LSAVLIAGTLREQFEFSSETTHLWRYCYRVYSDVPIIEILITSPVNVHSILKKQIYKNSTGVAYIIIKKEIFF